MLERERLEDAGHVNRLEEMQQTSWPVKRILQANFKIEMCFSYHDDDNNITLHWCRGHSQSIVCDKSYINNNIEVKEMHDEEYLEVGDINQTNEWQKEKL